MKIYILLSRVVLSLRYKTAVNTGQTCKDVRHVTSVLGENQIRPFCWNYTLTCLHCFPAFWFRWPVWNKNPLHPPKHNESGFRCGFCGFSWTKRDTASWKTIIWYFKWRLSPLHHTEFLTGWESLRSWILMLRIPGPWLKTSLWKRGKHSQDHILEMWLQ